jgi:hypothetical protein
MKDKYRNTEKGIIAERQEFLREALEAGWVYAAPGGKFPCLISPALAHRIGVKVGMPQRELDKVWKEWAGELSFEDFPDDEVINLSLAYSQCGG